VNIQDIPIDSIHVAKDRQLTDASTVPTLAESIKSIGLQAPIGVRANGDGHALVWGWKRLQAVKSLGWKVVPASIVTLDDLHAALAEIDENLCRAELTEAQRAKQLHRRKELYLALHPETKQHSAGGHAKAASDKFVACRNAPGFAEDTAAKTGKSKRSVERAVKVGSKLDDKALAMIACHPIADNQSELKKLAEYDPTEQREICGRLARGKLQRVPEKAREAALAAMEPGLEKALRDDLDADTKDVVALSKLSHGEQKGALKAVRSGEFGSLHDWLHGKPVESIKEPAKPVKPKVARADADMPRHQIDDNGELVPEKLLPIFEARPLFVELERDIRQLGGRIKEIQGKPWGKHVGVDDWRDMTALAERVRDAAPSVVVDGKTWLPRGAK